MVLLEPSKKEELDMKRIGSLLTAGALALSLVTLPAGAAEAAPALEETAQAAAQAALTAGGAQSIQYALWQDGEIILTGHAGNYSRTENRALTDDILYGVGSVSKTYTAAAVLKLVDEGKVELDAPVTAYLPDFTMTDADGATLTLADFKGKPVLLNFWASWCGPCASEMPDIQSAWEEHGNDVEFVIVNMTDMNGETEQSAKAFLAENNYTFPCYFDAYMGAMDASVIAQGIDMLTGNTAAPAAQ